MSRHGPERSPLLVFFGVSFGGSILLSLAIGLSGGHESPFLWLAPLSMFVPALGVLAARITSGASLGIAGSGLPLRWLPVALLLLPLAIHAIALPGVMALEGRLPWVAWLTPGPDGLFHTPPEQGWGTLTAAALAGRIALNAVAGLLFVSFLAFFEEIGWRAFLLPRLAGRLGTRRAALASALLWAAWHIPYDVSGIPDVDNVSPAALALVHPLGTFGAGLFLAFLWFKTKSLLLVSLAHGALNNWGQYAFKFMKTSGERDLSLLVLVAATVLAVGIGALARTRQLRLE